MSVTGFVGIYVALEYRQQRIVRILIV
jgi:hypothetical protein